MIKTVCEMQKWQNVVYNGTPADITIQCSWTAAVSTCTAIIGLQSEKICLEDTLFCLPFFIYPSPKTNFFLNSPIPIVSKTFAITITQLIQTLLIVEYAMIIKN